METATRLFFGLVLSKEQLDQLSQKSQFEAHFAENNGSNEQSSSEEAQKSPATATESWNLRLVQLPHVDV